MQRTLVILAVGLSPRLLGEHTPHLLRLAKQGAIRPLTTVTPAVTCSVQATLMTGLAPKDHGIVANGWYFHDLAEVLFWRQNEALVAGEKIWDAAKLRNPSFTCAKMFWWYNMYTSADVSATPRPMYPADGRKIPDHYTNPEELHDELNKKLGIFPLFKFWGPMTDITSSEWITDATLHVMETRTPTLTMTYLPHLDYVLQRLGPDLSHPELQKDLRALDELCGKLIAAAEASGQRVIVVSEYGITSVDNTIHLNRELREAGWLKTRKEENGRETLDAGASDAFSVADHQIAHIYIKDPGHIQAVNDLVCHIDGVEAVWDAEQKAANGLDHRRSGQLIAVAEPKSWFSYYYWLNDRYAPDYARTVDIHRKPGYDPLELFLDPSLRMPRLTTAWKLAKRKLGFRQLLDVIPYKDTQLVKGSHGRLTDDPADGPLVISSNAELMSADSIEAVRFKELVLDHIFK